MDILNWMNNWKELASAGLTFLAVLVALGIGVASLVQTNCIQKRERTERVLNEIIEWAIEVATLEYSIPFQEPPKIFTDMLEKKTVEDRISLADANFQDFMSTLRTRFANLSRNYETLTAKGEYILILANTTDFKSIIDDIKQLKDQLEAYNNTLLQLIGDIGSETLKSVVTEQAKTIQKMAVALVKKASKLKIRGM